MESFGFLMNQILVGQENEGGKWECGRGRQVIEFRSKEGKSR
jgi:hypothetical protein